MNVNALVTVLKETATTTEATELTNRIITSALPILKTLRDIGSILSVCGIILAGVMTIFSSDPKQVSASKSAIIRIALGLGVVWLAPYLFSAICSLFNADTSAIATLLNGLKVGA